MKFFCLCMSPAIDAMVRLPSAPKGEGEIFKDVVEEENVGGKAVNVARWLAIRGAEVACGGLLGEDNDRAFAKELAKYAIGDRFVRVPGATRRNEMIVWPGGSVKLNRAAFPGLAAVPSLDSLLSLSSFSSPRSPFSRARCRLLFRRISTPVPLRASNRLALRSCSMPAESRSWRASRRIPTS